VLRSKAEPKTTDRNYKHKHLGDSRKPFEEKKRGGQQFRVARGFESYVNDACVQEWRRAGDGKEKQAK
jgi:hypothetical protein